MGPGGPGGGPGQPRMSQAGMMMNQRMPQMQQAGNPQMMGMQSHPGNPHPVTSMGNNMAMMNQQQMRQGMSPQEMAMMRMQMQQQMRPGEPGMNMPQRPNMMPNGMMMRPGGPNGQMGMMGGPNGMMQGAMMGGHPAMSGHPAMQQGMGNRPPPPEYGMSSQNQNMPFMMSQHQMHGMNPNMRMPGGPGGMMPGRGPGGVQVRNPGMQQIPPSGPMMRQQNPLGDRMRQPGQMPSNMNPNMMAMMGGMKPGMGSNMNNMGPGSMMPGMRPGMNSMMNPGMVGANNGTMSRSPNPLNQAWQGGQQSMGGPGHPSGHPGGMGPGGPGGHPGGMSGQSA